MEQLELIEKSPETIELKTIVNHDEYTEKLAEFFDFRFEGEIVTEIKRAKQATDSGQPALVEMITKEEENISDYGR